MILYRIYSNKPYYKNYKITPILLRISVVAYLPFYIIEL